MFTSRPFAFVCTVLLAASGLCASAHTAVAQQPADKEAIDSAVDQGVRYLKRAQKPTGHWGPKHDEAWSIGYTALAGLTLAECGVPSTDPGIKQAAAIVRAKVGELES